MELEQFNGMLLDHSGVVGQLFSNRFAREERDRETYSSLFFKVRQPKEELLAYSASIVTAPVCFLILAAEGVLASVVDLLNSMMEIIFLEPENAVKSIISSVTNLVIGALCAIAAVLSPFVNLIDVIGSTVTTLQSEEDEGMMYQV